MYCYHCMNQLPDGAKYCNHCGRSTAAEDVPHHLQPGTVLEDIYLVGNSIGEGGFGITYVGMDMSVTPPVKVAVKEFYPNGFANRNNKVTNKVTLNYQNDGAYFRNGKLQFLSEAQSLANFRDEPGIVKVRDFFTANDTAYIIMEYVDGVTLTQRVKTGGVFRPEEIFRMMLPIMGSLQKMHAKGIIHRDISPDNIKLTPNGTLKLLDFGAARYFAGAQKKTMSVMFKPGYAPYEQYSTDSPQGAYTDVYGLCATLYKCITGITPPDAVKRLGDDTLRTPSSLNIPITQSLENVLLYGLTVKPAERCPDMSTLAEATEAALRGEDFTDARTIAAPPTDINDAGRTRHGDPDLTQRADLSGGGTTGGGMGSVAGGSMRGGYVPPQQPPQKNTNKTLMIILIVMTALIVAAIGAITALVILFNDKDDDGADAATTAVVSAVDHDADSGKSSSSESKTEASTALKMVSVVGKTRSEAQTELNRLGLSIKIEEKNSSTVPKDCVIEQSVSEGSTVEEGDSVTLVISKGEAVNDKPYNQKVVVSASEGSSYADMEVFNWEDGKWVSKFSCDATVGKNGGISSANSERNTLTPKGEFHLGVVLAAGSVSTSMQVHTATSSTCVCDDTSYPQYYNQIFDSPPSGVHCDKIGQKLVEGGNNALIFIEHNGTGFSSAGVSTENSSVITICGCYSAIAPTNGCIDISASDMTTLLSILDAGKNPYIITEVD